MESEIRQIALPEKDRPLREDVSQLGSLVGEMLVDQHGQGLLDLVERVRKASIRNRESECIKWVTYVFSNTTKS